MITNVKRGDKAFAVVKVAELFGLDSADLRKMGVSLSTLEKYRRGTWIAISDKKIVFAGNDKRSIMGKIAFGADK